MLFRSFLYKQGIWSSLFVGFHIDDMGTQLRCSLLFFLLPGIVYYIPFGFSSPSRRVLQTGWLLEISSDTTGCRKRGMGCEIDEGQPDELSSCYARVSRKGRITWVYCTQSYLAFLQNAVFTTQTRDVLVT